MVNLAIPKRYVYVMDILEYILVFCSQCHFLPYVSLSGATFLACCCCGILSTCMLKFSSELSALNGLAGRVFHSGEFPLVKIWDVRMYACSTRVTLVAGCNTDPDLVFQVHQHSFSLDLSIPEQRNCKKALVIGAKTTDCIWLPVVALFLWKALPHPLNHGHTAERGCLICIVFKWAPCAGFAAGPVGTQGCRLLPASAVTCPGPPGGKWSSGHLNPRNHSEKETFLLHVGVFFTHA